MPDRTDVDFTYSLTDRIAWLRSFPAPPAVQDLGKKRTTRVLALSESPRHPAR
jgi:hypothetical protein